MSLTDVRLEITVEDALARASLAQLRAAIIRLEGHVLEAPGWRLDKTGQAATWRGRTAKLTTRETEVLAELIRAEGRWVDRGVLCENVWGGGFDRDVEHRNMANLRVYLLYLRRKLGQGAIIATPKARIDGALRINVDGGPDGANG